MRHQVTSAPSGQRLLGALRFLPLLLVLCLLAPHAVAEDEAPAPVAALDWDDIKFLESALQEACDAVAAECSAAYPERPTVRITTRKEMREILTKEMGPIFKNTMGADEAQTKAISKVLADALAAKYEPTTNIIHVMPRNIRALTKAAGIPEAANTKTAKVLMAHEATHALDFQRFPALERERMNRKSKEGVECVGAMMEGHAQFVAQRVAVTWNMQSSFDQFTKVITSGVKTDDPAVRMMQDSMLAEHHFAYVQGHKFMQAVFAARGRAGVDAALASPPTSSRMVERPQEYLGASEGPAAFDVEPLFAHFRPLFEGPGWNIQVQTLKRMQMRAIFNALPKEKTEPVLSKLDETRALIGINGRTGQIGTLIVMRYPDRALASAHLEITEMLLRQKDEMLKTSASIRIEEAIYEDGIGPDHAFPGLYCMKKVSANGNKQTVTLHCGSAKTVAFEFTLIDVEMKRDAQDAYAALIMAHLLGKDTTGYVARAQELSGHVPKEEVPSPEKQPTSAVVLAGDALRLKALAALFQAAQLIGESAPLEELGKDILPTRAELTALLREGAAATAFAKGYEGPLQDGAGNMPLMAGQNIFKAPADRSEVHVYSATTEQIEAGEASEFPGGLRRFAKRVAAPGRTWFVLEMVEPGKNAGTKFSVFTKLGERFVFLAKPWRYVPSEDE